MAGLVLGAVAVAGACSSSDGSGAESSGGDEAAASTTTTAAPNTERPEGTWTVVSYEVSRSDGVPEYVNGNASVRLVKYEPTCETGPCNIKVSAGGADGTFLPAGEPRMEGADYTGEPYEMVWNEDTQTYTHTSEPEIGNCTNAAGETITDGYSVTVTRTYTFRPPTDDAPAGLFGERLDAAESTEPGGASGCTPYTETNQTAGAPVGEVTADASQLAGEYRTSWTVEKDENDSGDETLPVGYAAVLGTWKIDGAGPDLQLTATTKQPFPLAPAGEGWSGTLNGATEPCVATETSAPLGLWDLTEAVNDLTPVAFTEEGSAILNGTWSYSATPQPDARTNGCSQTSQAAMVTLVPTSALG